MGRQISSQISDTVKKTPKYYKNNKTQHRIEVTLDRGRKKKLNVFYHQINLI